MSSDTKYSSSSSTAIVNPNFEIMDQRTLRELAAPDVSIQIMCIQYPDMDVKCELKYGLIHLHPHKHLKEFHTLCTPMKPTRVSEEHIKLKTFLFSLQDAAKDWIYYLPTRLVTSWEGLKRVFLEKSFLTSRITLI